ncbi:MAG TPA: helix-turn-helix domain-containing protein, partial [Salinisphaeraceae bacterium]|nr:helix-turn-helix domain-containing protein [Salinisphaeraceae bacterium]
RRDLYFRINSVPLALPALRERREDILPLAEAMLARLNPDPERRATLAADAEQALRDYKWPGNIRELRNVLERAALLCDDCIITRSDLRFETATAQTMRGESTNLTLQQIERQHIERVLQETDGKVAEAAVRLDVPRSTLYQKIKAYGIATSQRSRA